jgi:hypothetical protein
MEAEGKIIPIRKGTGLNLKREDLTPEKLKTFSGCETMSDQTAIDTVFAIQTFATILYELMSEQTSKNELKTAA